MVAVQQWRRRQRGGCGQCGGNAAAAAAADNVKVAAASWPAVRHQRGGGGGGSAAVAWRQWRSAAVATKTPMATAKAGAQTTVNNELKVVAAPGEVRFANTCLVINERVVGEGVI